MLHGVKCTLHGVKRIFPAVKRTLRAVGYTSDRLSADFCIGYRQSFITVFIKQFYFAILRDDLVIPSRRVLNVCKDFQGIKIAVTLLRVTLPSPGVTRNSVTVKNGRYDFSTSGLKPSIVPLSDEKLMPMAIIVRLSAA